MGRFSKIPDEIFIKVVEESNCIQDIRRKLGYSAGSGSITKYIKKRIEKLNIDTSHFGKYKVENYSHPRYTLDEIMVENSKYENVERLKQRILRANLLEYKCNNCGNAGEWQGKELVLQLEHKNGKHNDHRLENLCFLCPNCHSQTSTYSGKNAGKYSKKIG